MSVEVQHRLLMKLNVKDILSNRLDFSAAVRSEFKEEIPSNYHVLQPDRQRGSSSYGSPCTSNGDRLTSCHSSTYDSASSSPFSITKELTNVGSPLTPLSDASRSKSKSPVRAQSFLAEKSSSPVIQNESPKEGDRSSRNNSSSSNSPTSLTAEQKTTKKKKKKERKKTEKIILTSSSSSQRFSEQRETLSTKSSNCIETNSVQSCLPSAKAITLKIGSEVVSRTPLVNYEDSDSDSGVGNDHKTLERRREFTLTSKTKQSSSGDEEEEEDEQEEEEEEEVEEEEEQEHVDEEEEDDSVNVKAIIGPLKPGHTTSTKEALPKNGLRELVEKRKNVSTVGNPMVKRKRLLSERAEKEMAYPVIDKDNVSIWNWNDFKGIKGRNCGVGLYNNSNDCFLNAILQIIAHTAPLARFIVEKHSSDNCVRPQNQCLCCCMKVSHFHRLYNTNNPFTANWIRPHLRRIFPSHMQGMQEDAHELLTLLLDALDPPPGHNNLNGVPSQIQPKSSTPIEQIFGGTLRNQITCTVCRTPYINYERIRELNLAIRKLSDGESIKITNLLDIYFRDENVSSFDCKKCARKTVANRVTRVLRPPAVLLVQLKRFNAYGGKIRLPVSADMQVDLLRYLFDGSSSTPSSAKYVLTSVVEHLGSGVDHGHYVSYVRGYDGHKWFMFDDEQMTGVSAHKVEDSSPYLLVYSRLCDIPTRRTLDVARPMGINRQNGNYTKINHSPFPNRTGLNYTSPHGYGKKLSGPSTSYGMPKWKPGII